MTTPRREALAVGLITVAAAIVRLWGSSRLGLSHFDEGIYADAGMWSLGKGGLADLNPGVIPYAPPGWPILVGLAYLLLGAVDSSAIFAAQLAGIATVPVVAWIARRTFGPGAGVFGAALAAGSGPHVAFSRMAMTDTPFLLLWLAAIGLGGRFLERPTVLRALGFGLAVGLAQQFKYNGWLAGAAIAGTALVDLITGVRPRRESLKALAMGGLAIAAAGAVVWPWYRFVEAHGGYSALLAHQRSYLGGWRSWGPNLKAQLGMTTALSGGPIPGGIAGLVGGCAACWAVRGSRQALRIPVALAVITAFAPSSGVVVGLLTLPATLRDARPARRVLGVTLALMLTLTPFYHPYARLWMPISGLTWLILGGRAAEAIVGGVRLDLRWLIPVALLLGWLAPRHLPLPGLLAPTDSLERLAAEIGDSLPKRVRTLRVYARPPLIRDLQRIPERPVVGRLEGLSAFEHVESPDIWHVVDDYLLATAGMPEARGLPIWEKWEVVRRFDDTPSLPTLLDLEPAAGYRKQQRAFHIWLLRPR